MKYLLITDASPEKVLAKTGIIGVPAPNGMTLIKDQGPPDLGEFYRMMREWEALRNPRRCNCFMIHRADCPMGMT